MQTELQSELRMIKQPVPLTVDFIQSEDTITLVVYSGEVMAYQELERYLIYDYLKRLQQSVQSYGWECELEGRHGNRPS
jgi:hypothetical protein